MKAEGLSAMKEMRDAHRNGDAEPSDADRKAILDGLGEAGSQFRVNIYANAFSGERVNLIADSKYRKDVEELSKRLLAHMDKTGDPRAATFRQALGKLK